MNHECLFEEPLKIVPIVHQVAAGLFQVHFDLMTHSYLRICAPYIHLGSPFYDLYLHMSIQLIGVQTCTIQHFF